jgi:hypothetical protein
MKGGAPMIVNQARVAQLVRARLPKDAQLMTIDQGGSSQPAVYAADLDGDGLLEIAAVYRYQGELYLIVLKHSGNRWEVAAQTKGKGYQVTVLMAAPVTGRSSSELIVGWQTGSIWSTLSIYELTKEGLREVPPDNVSFSYLEVEDMPSSVGWDQRAELVLWIHDTGEAYNVKVVRWRDGQLVPAPDVYPYYYPRVVQYYEHEVRMHPDYSFYWYYLADAQLKAGMPQAAAESIRQGLSLNHAYPSEEMWKELQQQLQPAGMYRDIHLFPASVKTADGVKWGYIDSKGTMVLPPQYDYAFDFQENGLAVVQVGERNGLINTSGAYVVKPVYQSISSFSEGRAIVMDDQGSKVMNEAGRIITHKAYGYIAPYKNGRAVFSIQVGDSSKYGYLDLQGNEVIAAKYLQANDFANGKAVVQEKDNEFALIGLDGGQLAVFPYAYVGQPGDGLLPFQKEPQGKYGYIDEKGNVVIQPAYTNAWAFQDERAIVVTSTDNDWIYGLIDKQGNFVIKPSYNSIQTLGEQRLALGKAIDPKQPYIGSLYAIADLNGQQLSGFRYNDVQEYNKGLASVHDRRQTYFIDRSGKPAPGYPKVDGTGVLTWQNPLIQANVDQRLSYLDRAGNVIWRQNTVIPLRPPYKVLEEKFKPNKDYLVYYPQVEGMADKAAQKKVNTMLKEKSQVKKVPPDKQLEASYTGDFEVSKTICSSWS